MGLYHHSSLMRTDCVRFGLQQHPAGSLRLQNTDFYVKLKPQRESLLAARWLSSASRQPWHLSVKLLRLPPRMSRNWEKKGKRKKVCLSKAFWVLAFRAFRWPRSTAASPTQPEEDGGEDIIEQVECWQHRGRVERRYHIRDKRPDVSRTPKQSPTSFTCCASTFKRFRFIFCLQSAPFASECVLFNRLDKTRETKRKKPSRGKIRTELVFPLNNLSRISFAAGAYADTLLSDALLSLPLIWGDSGAQKPLRPDKSNHHTNRISLKLCVTRFDPTALSEMLDFVGRPERRRF